MSAKSDEQGRQIEKADQAVQSNLKPDPIDEVVLSADEVRDVLYSAAGKAVGRALPGFGVLFSMVEAVNDEVREEKLRILLTQFQDRFASADQALKKLKTICGTRGGMLLFRKVLHILDNGDADEEWVRLLAATLESMSKSDIEAMFSELSYLLSIIDKVSPQALVLLSKHSRWQNVDLQGGTTTSKQTVVGDWEWQVADHFARAIGIARPGVQKYEEQKARMAHTFRELQGANLLLLTANKRVEPTPIGREILKFLNPGT